MNTALENFLYLFTGLPSVSWSTVLMGAFGALLVWLILYTTKDVLARSQSFVFMIFAVLLVTALPIIGFILYLLIRPSSTALERTLLTHIAELQASVAKLEKHLAHKQPPVAANFVVKSKKLKKTV